MKHFIGRVSISGMILTIAGTLIIGYLLHGHLMAARIEYKIKSETKPDLYEIDFDQEQTVNNSNNDEIISVFNEKSKQSSTRKSDYYYSNSLPWYKEDQNQKRELSSWTGDDENPEVFARMTIPEIDLTVPVVEGVEKDNLKLAIGHVPGTGIPGGTGNSAYAGHRSHTYGKFFHRLGEIEPGDKIIVETLLYKYKYTVTEIFKVNPDEVWVLDDIPGGTTITLITCEPLYGNKYRLIVRGLLEDV